MRDDVITSRDDITTSRKISVTTFSHKLVFLCCFSRNSGQIIEMDTLVHVVLSKNLRFTRDFSKITVFPPKGRGKSPEKFP